VLTRNRIRRIVEQTLSTSSSSSSRSSDEPAEPFSGDPIDDPDNPDVPKGGKWGVTGAAQTPEMFRSRVGTPGLNKSGGGKIKPVEVQKLAQRIDQVEPDDLIVYSRGAQLYNTASPSTKSKPASVTYMAPSSYRDWGGVKSVPRAGAGKVTIGDQDTLVPMKQAAKNAVDAGVPMYVLPGFSHVGIMYSHGNVTPGGFEVDPEGIISDPEMPDWGPSGSASGGKEGPVIQAQAERVKQHVKEERELRKLLRIVNERF
jgi:hypothetical protein